MESTSKPYKNSFAGKGVFPPRYAFTLLFPVRNLFLSPKRLLERLELQADHTVLEIGPGPGYFSPHVARQLSRGRLVLADIQQEMLDYAARRMKRKKIENIDFYHCNGFDFDFADACFDRIFMVTVIGEVVNQERYLEEIYRILKPDGLLSISELAGDPDNLSVEELQALVEPFGFELDRLFGSKRNYTMNFRRMNRAAAG